MEVFYNKNLLWIFARQVYTVTQKISSWSEFNITIRTSVSISRDIVGYMPTINAPVTEMSIVLKQSENIRQNMYLQDIVVVMDQTLDALRLSRSSVSMQNITLRLGTFHTICNCA
jgi:hypothetical protein